jgi:dihydrofolate reductase
MRKLIAGFASSVDGYIEGPNGEYDWILIDKEINFTEQAKQFDAYFFGRKSYEGIVAMGGGATPGVTNYVFSNTLATVDKNYTLVTGDIKEQVIKLKQTEGKDIALFGGASLLSSLLNLQLVDEIVVTIIPVLLGKGKPMVDVLKQKVWLHFIKSRSYANGTLQATYSIAYSKSK